MNRLLRRARWLVLLSTIVAALFATLIDLHDAAAVPSFARKY